MELNKLKPAPGSNKARRRVGRGIGSGLGKTAGRGHKGQHARSGGFHKVGFEGGQMPLQRRLPKRGFVSHIRTEEVRLSELALVDGDRVDLASLKQAGIITIHADKAKIILSGALDRKVSVVGVGVSKGAKAAIELAGGNVEILPTPEPTAKQKKKDAERKAKVERIVEATKKVEAQKAAPAPKKAKAEPKAEGEKKAQPKKKAEPKAKG